MKDFTQWRQVTDPMSNKRYYYQKKTGEVTWEAPAEWLMAARAVYGAASPEVRSAIGAAASSNGTSSLAAAVAGLSSLGLDNIGASGSNGSASSAPRGIVPSLRLGGGQHEEAPASDESAPAPLDDLDPSMAAIRRACALLSGFDGITAQQDPSATAAGARVSTASSPEERREAYAAAVAQYSSSGARVRAASPQSQRHLAGVGAFGASTGLQPQPSSTSSSPRYDSGGARSHTAGTRSITGSVYDAYAQQQSDWGQDDDPEAAAARAEQEARDAEYAAQLAEAERDGLPPAEGGAAHHDDHLGPDAEAGAVTIPGHAVYPPPANPPLQKRPDLYNLLFAHRVEMGAFREARGEPAEPPALVEGILPADVIGAELSPRSEGLQLCGYLSKRSSNSGSGGAGGGASGLFAALTGGGKNAWQRRFFISHRWLLLYYGRDGDAATAPLGALDLRWACEMRIGFEVAANRARIADAHAATKAASAASAVADAEEAAVAAARAKARSKRLKLNVKQAGGGGAAAADSPASAAGSAPASKPGGGVGGRKYTAASRRLGPDSNTNPEDGSASESFVDRAVGLAVAEGLVRNKSEIDSLLELELALPEGPAGQAHTLTYLFRAETRGETEDWYLGLLRVFLAYGCFAPPGSLLDHWLQQYQVNLTAQPAQAPQGAGAVADEGAPGGEGSPDEDGGTTARESASVTGSTLPDASGYQHDGARGWDAWEGVGQQDAQQHEEEPLYYDVYGQVVPRAANPIKGRQSRRAAQQQQGGHASRLNVRDLPSEERQRLAAARLRAASPDSAASADDDDASAKRSPKRRSEGASKAVEEAAARLLALPGLEGSSDGGEIGGTTGVLAGTRTIGALAATAAARTLAPSLRPLPGAERTVRGFGGSSAGAAPSSNSSSGGVSPARLRPLSGSSATLGASAPAPAASSVSTAGGASLPAPSGRATTRSLRPLPIATKPTGEGVPEGGEGSRLLSPNRLPDAPTSPPPAVPDRRGSSAVALPSPPTAAAPLAPPTAQPSSAAAAPGGRVLPPRRAPPTAPGAAAPTAPPAGPKPPGGDGSTASAAPPGGRRPPPRGPAPGGPQQQQPQAPAPPGGAAPPARGPPPGRRPSSATSVASVPPAGAAPLASAAAGGNGAVPRGPPPRRASTPVPDAAPAPAVTAPAVDTAIEQTAPQPPEPATPSALSSAASNSDPSGSEGAALDISEYLPLLVTAAVNRAPIDVQELVAAVETKRQEQQQLQLTARKRQQLAPGSLGSPLATGAPASPLSPPPRSAAGPAPSTHHISVSPVQKPGAAGGEAAVPGAPLSPAATDAAPTPASPGSALAAANAPGAVAHAPTSPEFMPPPMLAVTPASPPAAAAREVDDITGASPTGTLPLSPAHTLDISGAGEGSGGVDAPETAAPRSPAAAQGGVLPAVSWATLPSESAEPAPAAAPPAGAMAVRMPSRRGQQQQQQNGATAADASTSAAAAAWLASAAKPRQPFPAGSAASTLSAYSTARGYFGSGFFPSSSSTASASSYSLHGTAPGHGAGGPMMMLSATMHQQQPGAAGALVAATGIASPLPSVQQQLSSAPAVPASHTHVRTALALVAELVAASEDVPLSAAAALDSEPSSGDEFDPRRLGMELPPSADDVARMRQATAVAVGRLHATLAQRLCASSGAQHGLDELGIRAMVQDTTGDPEVDAGVGVILAALRRDPKLTASVVTSTAASLGVDAGAGVLALLARHVLNAASADPTALPRLLAAAPPAVLARALSTQPGLLHDWCASGMCAFPKRADEPAPASDDCEDAEDVHVQGAMVPLQAVVCRWADAATASCPSDSQDAPCSDLPQLMAILASVEGIASLSPHVAAAVHAVASRCGLPAARLAVGHHILVPVIAAALSLPQNSPVLAAVETAFSAAGTPTSATASLASRPAAAAAAVRVVDAWCALGSTIALQPAGLGNASPLVSARPVLLSSGATAAGFAASDEGVKRVARFHASPAVVQLLTSPLGSPPAIGGTELCTLPASAVPALHAAVGMLPSRQVPPAVAQAHRALSSKSDVLLAARLDPSCLLLPLPAGNDEDGSRSYEPEDLDTLRAALAKLRTLTRDAGVPLPESGAAAVDVGEALRCFSSPAQRAALLDLSATVADLKPSLEAALEDEEAHATLQERAQAAAGLLETAMARDAKVADAAALEAHLRDEAAAAQAAAAAEAHAAAAAAVVAQQQQAEVDAARAADAVAVALLAPVVSSTDLAIDTSDLPSTSSALSSMSTTAAPLPSSRARPPVAPMAMRQLGHPLMKPLALPAQPALGFTQATGSRRSSVAAGAASPLPPLDQVAATLSARSSGSVRSAASPSPSIYGRADDGARATPLAAFPPLSTNVGASDAAPVAAKPPVATFAVSLWGGGDATGEASDSDDHDE